MWRQRHSAGLQSAFSHLSGLSRHRTDYRCLTACTLEPAEHRRSIHHALGQRSPESLLTLAQPRGAFSLLRSTKRTAVPTTTSSGTAVNSSRAIAVQSVYTAEKKHEVGPSSQQTAVPLRVSTTRHSRPGRLDGVTCAGPADAAEQRSPAGAALFRRGQSQLLPDRSRSR